MTSFFKDEVSANLRRERKKLEDKLKAIETAIKEGTQGDYDGACDILIQIEKILKGETDDET